MCINATVCFCCFPDVCCRLRLHGRRGLRLWLWCALGMVFHTRPRASLNIYDSLISRVVVYHVRAILFAHHHHQHHGDAWNWKLRENRDM